MKIYSCHTPSHRILYDEHYSKTLPAAFESHPNVLDIEGAGDFKSAGFLNTIRAKIGLIVDSLELCSGSTIVWSDVDIVFFDKAGDLLDQVVADAPDCDVFFQKEFSGNRTDVNTGFMVIRCNDRSRDFFSRLLANEDLGAGKNEQEGQA